VADAAAENPFAQILVRALAFGQGIRWHIAEPTPVDQVVWTDLDTFGRTEMGHALRAVAEQLADLPSRSFPPVIVLVSDGRPTDDFDGGLAELMAIPWGRKAIRVAIAIGGDCDVDVLERFIGDPEVIPLTAGNPEELTLYLKFVSTAATKVASVPAARPDLGTAPTRPRLGGIAIPRPPEAIEQAVNEVTW
jgi:uncharacterized protein YegL